MRDLKKLNVTFILFGFIAVSCITAFILSSAISSELDIPHSIESDYFDVYGYNPIADAPSKIIVQPDKVAFPQYRFEYSYQDINLSSGFYSIDNINEIPKEDFSEKVEKSDDQYASIVPEIPHSQNELKRNYFVFSASVSSDYIFSYLLDNLYYPLSPDMDNYLAFDSVLGTSGDIVLESNVEDITTKFFETDDPYSLPNENAYYEVIEPTEEYLTFDIETGGVTIYNESLYQLYQILDANRDLILDGLLTIEFLEDIISTKDPNRYYEINIILHIINLQNRNFFNWFAEKCYTYEEFVLGTGINIDDGYKVFSNFNPYSISEISGKISIFLDYPDASAPRIDSYEIQCWNYILEDWVTQHIGREVPPMQLTNVWLFDEFKINTNSWQYVRPTNDTYADENTIRWRIKVNAQRDVGDTEPIRVKIGGLWTSIKQEFLEFAVDLTFKVDKVGIDKNDITSCNVILEYHTQDWEYLYDAMFITKFISSQNGLRMDYIVESEAFYDQPIRDDRKGLPIPSEIIESDTTVKITLYGQFSRYSKTGILRDPKVFFDKISMQYEFQDSVIIKRQSLINFNALELIWWTYDIEIPSNVVYLEFEHPLDWIFIDKYFGLVEKEGGNNVTQMWIESVTNVDIDDLYDDAIVRFDERTMFYLGPGRYRFWFRSFNYMKYSSITNSTGDEVEQNSPLEIDRYTNYSMYMNDEFLDNRRPSNYYGGMQLEFYGTDHTGRNTAVIGPCNGTQIPYTQGGYNRYNRWKVDYNHTYLDDLFGHIRIDYYWHNDDFTEVGFGYSWMYIAYVSFEKPIVSIISPINGRRLGVNQTNYAILASWHLNNDKAWIKIENEEAIELTKLSDAISEGENIPEELLSIPVTIQKFYFFTEINTQGLVENYSQSGSEELVLSLKGWSVAKIGIVEVYSDNVTINFKIVQKPEFILDPIEDIYINRKARINYYCPEGIESMDVYINTNIDKILIAEIGGTGQFQSSYLFRGYHTYVIPFRFDSPGQFSITMEVRDEIGNVIIIQSNNFSVVNDDDRLWFTRIIDELIETVILWASYIGIGIVYVKKNSNKLPRKFIFKEL